MQRRWKLSVVQRADMWNRWKKRDSHYMRLIGWCREGPSGHSVSVGASRRNRSGCSSSFATGTHLGRTGRHLRLHHQRPLDVSAAQRLGRSCSTVSREVARHGGRAQYRASEADRQAWDSALRPKPCRLATHSKLRKIVASKLALNCRRNKFPDGSAQQGDESLRVSHETIYRTLFHSSARSAETGADADQVAAAYTLAVRQHSRTLSGQNRRCHFHPRATCSGRSTAPVIGKAIYNT